ncbi:hypothetical protein D3C81_727270 [compost metagenome]
MSTKLPKVVFFGPAFSVVKMERDIDGKPRHVYGLLKRNETEEEDQASIDLNDPKYRWYLEPETSGLAFTEATAGRPLTNELEGHRWEELDKQHQ